MEAGWYVVEGDAPGDPGGRRLRADVTPLDGPSYSIPLGTFSAAPVLLGLHAPAARIALVAETEAGDMLADGHGLRRVGRVRAICMLLPGPRDGSGRRPWQVLPRNLLQLVRDAALGRWRSAVSLMAARYQAGLLSADARGLPACEATNWAGWGHAAYWRPVQDLRKVGGDPVSVRLEATGDDPQLRLDCAGAPLPLRAGWYVVEFHVDVEAGRLLAPALYPDYGRGCEPGDTVRLPQPDARGHIRDLVVLKADVAQLRFDPSVRRVRFRIESSRVRRIGRLAAMAMMLGRYRQSDGGFDWKAIASALGRFALDACAGGLSHAAARLHGGDQEQPGKDYAHWVRLYDTLDRRDLQLMHERAAGLREVPLVSVLLPVYETPARLLRLCLDSVLAQVYRNWELCVVDDASPSPHVQAILSEYQRRDPRIRVARRSSNGHISVASNDALSMARGRYVALLDHDDEIRPHALLEMVEMLTRQPQLALVYSDEDKIDESGRRFQPNFKPDWNPDLLLSQNYVCHFSMLRTDLVREVGGFRAGYEGSQDHDLFLRCCARLSPEGIGHVPKVLYHWRAVTGSTALERAAKDYASAAGAKAVSDHLVRTAPGTRVEELAHGHYRVRWPLPAPAPRVSIIVPTRDRLELLQSCIESVLGKSSYPDIEVLIVDNRSTDAATLAWLEQVQADPRVRVLKYDAEFNYSAINNWAASLATGEVLCLLNNDVEALVPDWLEEMTSHALRPGIGAVGAMLYYPDRTIQHAGVILGLGGVANHIYSGLPAGTPGHGARALVVQNVSAVTGACLVVRKALYQQLGGLEERLQVAFNDIDFCLRLCEAGYRNLWTPFAELVHHESASRGRDESEEKRARFAGEVAYMEHRWSDWLTSDPAYNPNLSLDDLAAGLAFPPRAAS